MRQALPWFSTRMTTFEWEVNEKYKLCISSQGLDFAWNTGITYLYPYIHILTLDRLAAVSSARAGCSPEGALICSASVQMT